MKLCLLLFFIVPLFSQAQVTISGTVKDKKGMPVVEANIYLKNIYDGGSTDDEGKFSFSTKAKDSTILVVSIIGYKTLEKRIFLSDKNLYFDLIIEEDANNLSTIVISTSAFEASDEKKGTILKPLDIVTNPGARGDIFGALQTLPGVAPSFDDTGLFVRGGEASEAKTIIDGITVDRPFFSNVPNIPSRGRFDPFLFKGTLFSTGGYSAQYGQALSSVLVLNTNDIPENSEYSLGLSMAGVNVSLTEVFKENTAFLASIGYTDLSTLFSIVPQNRSWEKPPNGITGSFGFRHLTENGSIFKSFLQYQKQNLGLNLAFDENQGIDDQFQNKNENLFWNNSYQGFLNDNWKIFAAIALNYDNDVNEIGSDKIEEKSIFSQGRITLSRKLNNITLRLGSEIQISKNEESFNQFSSSLNNQLIATYSEVDIKSGDKFAWRLGLRGEYSSIINAANFVPRITLSYVPNKKSLFSLSYGQFYQTPTNEFLRQNTQINFEKATHYIASYQYKTDKRILRIEGYYKDYKNLILTNLNQFLNNDGFGYSKGIDIFWRDEKTIPNLTYWLSYSLIDSKRLFQDFPIKATPTFISENTLSLVANYKIRSNIRLGMAYTFATGRTYLDPNESVFLKNKTIDYHNINFSSSYLTSIFGNFSVIYVSLRNPFQIKQVFGFDFSDDGSIQTPITPSSNWSFFAGVSISIRK